MNHCQHCRTIAPTQSVSLQQNIGLLVFRIAESTDGNLCRRCISQIYKRYTLVNLTLGWWGVISLFLTPILMISNTAQFLSSRRLPLVDELPTRQLQLPRATLDRMLSFKAECLACLERGDPREIVIIALAEQAQVSRQEASSFIAQEVDPKGRYFQ